MPCLTYADVCHRADKSERIVAAPIVIRTRCIFISLIFTLTSVPKWVKWTLTRVVQTCQVSIFCTLWTRLLIGIEEHWKVLQGADTRSCWCGKDIARVEGAFKQATGQRWWVVVECATLDIEIACYRMTLYPLLKLIKMLILTIATLKKRRDEESLEQLDGIGRLKIFARTTQSNVGLRESLSIERCEQHQEQHD